MTKTKVFNWLGGLLPALCVFLAAVLPGEAAWAAEAKPAGEYRIAQALTEEERNKRRAARQQRKEGDAAANGEARATRRKAKREGRAARAAQPAPRARPAAKPARPARRTARPAPPVRPPAAVARRNPKPAPVQKRRRSPIRKLERNVRKFFKRSLRQQRSEAQQRAADRRDVIGRREDFRHRDAAPRRFRERDVLRPIDGRGVGRREIDRRPTIVERSPRERFVRRDRDNWRRRELRRSNSRDVRRYARSRRHVVRARRYRNRFNRGRSIYYLPPVGVALAASLYALESSRASYDDYYGTFMAPPVRRLRRRYSLNDVVSDPEIRAAVRSVNIDIITFYSGSARIQPNQLHKLEDLADAIHATLRRRPDEVFLIAGHTDAVGPFDENLGLSERRAASVQRALIEEFGVPEENLESVGYGEQYLRIDTDAPDRRNRRVVVRAIGALLARR